MRKRFNSNLKLKVSLEAIKGDLTIPEIVSKYDVSPAQIHRWRKQLQQDGVGIFESTVSKSSSHEKEITILHANIGRLTVENNFLERALGRVK
jgi:transposase